MPESSKPEDKILIGFSAYITLKNGKRIWARSYGKKAFPLYLRTPKTKAEVTKPKAKDKKPKEFEAKNK